MTWEGGYDNFGGGEMARQNVGPLDRMTRISLGALTIGYRYIGQFTGVGWDLAVLAGAVWIWEGLLGFCLLYGLLGWSTKKRTTF